MKVGEAIVALLEDYGVRHVFGIPGTHSIELYRALESSPINHVLPRHEQGAGFMADGYARLTGEPGICFVITGPGVTNLSTAMAQAWSDSVPLLVISPVNDLTIADGTDEPLYQGRLHEIPDQSMITAPFSAFSCIAGSQAELEQLIHRAFNVFQTERPRPVHIHVPLSLLTSDVGERWQLQPVGSLEPDQANHVPEVINAFAQAQNPVIVAGGGCRFAPDHLTLLAERLSAPVVTSVAARGVIPGSHPLCVGAQLASTHSQQLIADSDLLLSVGCELSETDCWREIQLPEKQIWINLDPNVPFKHVSSGSDVKTLVADTRVLLPALCSSAGEPERETVIHAHRRAAQVRNKHTDEFLPMERKHWRVLTELMKHLPETAVVTSDMTQLAYTACNHLPLQQANSWFHPNGYGTLGYALPAAVGAMISRVDTPALAIVGDAGFQYTVAEFAVAVEHNLPLVVLLWNNDALQQIADDMKNAGIPPNAVVQQNPDFEKLSQAMGAEYRGVKGISDLGQALQDAFGLQTPILLELHQSTV